MQVQSTKLPVLTRSEWESVKSTADAEVIGKLRLPDTDDPKYKVRAFSKYPQWLIVVISAILLLVAVAAFWISAGKQIAATALILDPLGNSYNHLSGTWSNIGDLFALAFGEGATILFMLASSVLSGDPMTMNISEKRSLTFKPAVVIFRLFAIVGASLAIVANISITSMHDTAGQPVYAWMFALVPPITVLAIGLLVENLVMGTLKARADVVALLDAETNHYYACKEKPALHKEWFSIICRLIWDELIRRKKRSDAILPVVEANPELKEQIIIHIFKTNMSYENIGAALEAEMNRPMTPLSSPSEQSAAGVFQLQPTNS